MELNLKRLRKAESRNMYMDLLRDAIDVFEVVVVEDDISETVISEIKARDKYKLEEMFVRHGILIGETIEDAKRFLHSSSQYGLGTEDLLTIEQHVSEKFVVKGEDLLSRFYTNVDTVKHLSDTEILINQLIHYAFSYGYGITTRPDDNRTEEVFDIMDKSLVQESIKRIKVVTVSELADMIKERIMSSTPLSSENVEKIKHMIFKLTIIFDIDFKIDSDNIKNKELQAILLLQGEHLGIISNNATSFIRTIIYELTGNTLVVKNSKTIELIKYVMVNYSEKRKHVEEFIKYTLSEEMINISKEIHRYREIILTIRKNTYDQEVVTMINNVLKLNKKHKKPLTDSVFTNGVSMIKSKDGYTKFKKIFTRELENKNVGTYQLIKLYNAIAKHIDELQTSEYLVEYPIRNGKSYYKYFKNDVNSNTNKENISKLKSALGDVKSVISNRVLETIKKNNITFKNANIFRDTVFTLPTSAKQFCGNIPKYSHLIKQISHRESRIGVTWYEDVDVDLSSIFLTDKNNMGKIAWNTNLKNKIDSTKLTHSGDMTGLSDGRANETIGINTTDLSLATFNTTIYSYRYFTKNGLNVKLNIQHGDKNIVIPMMLENEGINIAQMFIEDDKNYLVFTNDKTGNSSTFNLPKVYIGNNEESGILDKEKVYELYREQVVRNVRTRLTLNEIVNEGYGHLIFTREDDGSTTIQHEVNHLEVPEKEIMIDGKLYILSDKELEKLSEQEKKNKSKEFDLQFGSFTANDWLDLIN